MDRNMYTLAVRRTWFSDSFDYRKVVFDSDSSMKYVWELRKKLSERHAARPEECEAVAAFEAIQLHGPEVGRVAIMKIHMQVPVENGPYWSEDPKVRANLAGVEPFTEALDEANFLAELTEAGCPVSPQLLGFRMDEQDEDMWIPGGYIIYILMEKLPGGNIYDFHTWPREKRDEIREAFIQTMSELIRYGIEPNDYGLRNILWDEKNGKCYIVDFESCYYTDTELGPDGLVADRTTMFAFWDLVRGDGPDYEW